VEVTPSLPEPTERLPAEALSYWRVTTAATAVVAVAISVAATAALGSPWSWLVPIVVAAAGVAAVGLAPGLRHRRWRYAVREQEIDIRHGTFVVKRTVVPIRRVQHVDTEQGPLQGMFGLASVAFHTAAGETEIPALRQGQAELVRARIAELARTLDDV
jgi:membrane protein YdbS with pleckstrin-like domain